MEYFKNFFSEPFVNPQLTWPLVIIKGPSFEGSGLLAVLWGHVNPMPIANNDDPILELRLIEYLLLKIVFYSQNNNSAQTTSIT